MAPHSREDRARAARRFRPIAAAALFLLAAAATAFEGRVVLQATGAPVGGAEVSVLGWNVSQLTDPSGKFTWEPTPVAPFEVLVVLPGGRYMRPVRVLAIPAEGPVTIEVAPLAEESVTVTAGAAPTIESSPVAGTTIVPRADIESRQPLNLTQSLENVAGISKVSEGQAAVPAIRGLARGRSLILIDGARVSTERRVGAGASYLDPFLLDAVEVSRGAGSVGYGSDAFGGVISARTRGIVPGAGFGVRATGGYAVGTPGGRAGVELSGPLGAEGGFAVLGHFLEYSNYDSPDGEIDNSQFRETGVLVKAAHRVGPGLLTAGWQGDWGRDIGRPRNNSTTVRFSYPEENSSRFTLNYDLDPVAGFSRMGLTAFLGSYDLITDQDRFATVARPRSIERADVTADDFSVRAFAERFFGPVRVEAGVDVNGRYDLHALDIAIVFEDPVRTSVNVSVEDAHKTDAGGYVTAEAPILPMLTAAGGVRYDSVTTSNTDGYFGDLSTSDGNVSGFIGLTAGSFGGFSATAQFSTGYRDPTLSDRYFRGPSGRGFITGNPELLPETSLQYDFALRYLGACYRLAFYGYQYDIHDYIERYAGTLPDDFFFRNRGQARLRGLELEAQVDLPEGISLALAGQIERGETLDDDRALDDVPPESINLQVRKSFGRGYAQIRGAAFAALENPGPGEIETPGYGILDLGGGFNVTPWFELQAYVRNVLDHRYAASPDPRNVLAPGINATFTAFLRF